MTTTTGTASERQAELKTALTTQIECLIRQRGQVEELQAEMRRMQQGIDEIEKGIAELTRDYHFRATGEGELPESYGFLLGDLFVHFSDNGIRASVSVEELRRL